MKKQNFWFIFGILIIIAAIFISLWITNKLTRNQESIKIGVILSLTGNVGDYGQRSLKGLLLGLEKINNEGGLIGKKIELIIEDARSDPKAAISAYQKLLSIHSVRIIIGDVYSSTTLAVAPLAEKDKIVLLAPGASNPKMREMGDFIFRNWTSDEFDGYALANYTKHKLGFSQISIIYQQVEYTVGLADAFKREMEKMGGRVIDMIPISTGAVNAREIVFNIIKKNPEVVYVCAEARESAIIVKYLREGGFKNQIIANLTVESPEFISLAGQYTDGIIFSTPAFDPEDTSLNIKEFTLAYKSKYGELPDAAAGHAYDAILIIAEVIRRAGTIDPIKIKDELYKIRDFAGVTGNTTFDMFGDVIKDILIKKFNKGKIQKLEHYRIKDI